MSDSDGRLVLTRESMAARRREFLAKRADALDIQLRKLRDTAQDPGIPEDRWQDLQREIADVASALQTAREQLGEFYPWALDR